MLISAFAGDAETGNDSLQISLITCSPGNEAYTLFGHTALRVHDESKQTDWVFNYGMFNYRSENFVWRFVLGETDYELGVEPADFFFGRYLERGFRVNEQLLRLDSTQCAELQRLLVENAKPANKVYRYNFLYDNCTTRALDVMEKCFNDGIDNCDKERGCETFREVLHGFLKECPWTKFGIDMVLGAELDEPRTVRELLFVPSRLEHWVDEQGMALPIRSYDGGVRMLPMSGFPLPPMTVFLIVSALTAFVSWLDLRRRRLSVWLDVLLILAQGLCGVLIAFLFFFSVHPGVGSNWLVVAFNPLVLALLFCLKSHSIVHRCLEIANLSALSFVLLLFFVPLQWIHPAVLPLVFSLLIRGGVRLLLTSRKIQK